LWVYSQSSGIMLHDGIYFATGYSGIHEGLNNPNMQHVHSVGPIPRGLWVMGPDYHHPKLGACTMNLLPKPGTEVFGRTDFRIHADLRLFAGKHIASHGCIIHVKTERMRIAASHDRDLEVII